MSDQVWGLIFIVVIVAALMAIIGQVLGMRGQQLADKAEVARDQAYRKLAEDTVAAQQAMLEEQQKIAAELAQVKARLGAIEKVLNEVG